MEILSPWLMGQLGISYPVFVVEGTLVKYCWMLLRYVVVVVDEGVSILPVFDTWGGRSEKKFLRSCFPRPSNTVRFGRPSKTFREKRVIKFLTYQVSHSWEKVAVIIWIEDSLVGGSLAQTY